MFATTAAVVFVAASVVSAASVVPRAKYAVPTTYTAKWLEPYDDYHTRYLGLQCDQKHNTKLFDECCHPMLKWEKIDTARPKYCVPGAFTPASVISTTVKATATATIKPVTRIALTSTSSAAPSASSTPVVDDDEEDCDEEDDDEEDCDEEDDDEDECVEGEADCVCEEIEIPVTSAAKPTSTKVPSSTVQATSTSSRSVVYVTSTVTAASSSKAATTVIPSSGAFTFSSSSRMTRVRVSSTVAASSSSQAPVVTSSAAPETPKTTATPTSSKALPTAPVDLTKQTTGTYKDGFATYYKQNGNAGACGEFKGDADKIAAIDFRRYGNLNVKSGLCGARLTVTNTNNGKSVDVIVKDACPSCKNANSVDLSEGAFKAIATIEEGMVPIKVTFAGRE